MGAHPPEVDKPEAQTLRCKQVRHACEGGENVRDLLLRVLYQMPSL